MRRLCGLLAGAACAVASWTGTAQSTSSAAILAASADLGCLHYRAVGMCVWMRCGTVTGCEARTSVKYRHFVPEAVVTAYGAREAHPWAEAAGLAAGAFETDGGTAARGTAARGGTGLRFRMAEVVGSPGIAWIEAMGSAATMCEAHAEPLGVYYVSGADPMWRLEAAQLVWTLRHATRRVKEPGLAGSLWGAVYPRTGFVQQHHDYKAAAVAAQRAADIATRTGQWHLYRPLTGRDRAGNWGPDPVREGVEGNHKWQLLVPRRQGCRRFAASGDTPAAGAGDPLARNVSETSSYLWQLWRPYECCERRGQTLVAHW